MFVTCFLMREIKFGMFLNSLHEMKMKLLMFSISERSSQTFSGNLMFPFLSILFITPIVFELPTLLLISSLINPGRNLTDFFSRFISTSSISRMNKLIFEFWEDFLKISY